MRNSSTRLAFVAAAIVIMSCSGRGDRAADIEQWSGEPPIAGAWLRERLPAEAVAYVRVPHPLGLMSMPKGGMLDTALGSTANMQAVANVRTGFVENVLARLPAAGNPLIALAAKLESPLEIATVGPPTMGILIGATLDFASTAALEQWLAAPEVAQFNIALAAPLDADGAGELIGLPMPAFLRFDAATGRLAVLAGPGATAGALGAVLTADPSAAHPMHAAEARIDSSGHGLFSWVDVRAALPLAQGFLPPGAAVELGPLAAARAIALGAGNADGKGRLALLVEMADAQARPFPVVANELTASAAGEPDALLLFSIPSAAELARLESLLAALPTPRAEWNDVKAAFRDGTGVSIEEILTAIGPDLLAIMDAAGDYGALRVRDAALFDDIVRRLAARLGTAPTERTIDGTTFWHWQLPSSMALAAAQAASAGELGAILGRLSSHLYWTRDGDYVYFAALPQPLLDRARSDSPTEIAAWLSDTQRVDLSSALLGATGTVDKVPRRMYHAYVSFMHTLSDLAGVELDAFALPTADELALPDEGRLGLALSLGDPYVSLELSYEVHPGELLAGGGGMASVAMLGIAAAIAIPAYQDYTARATVAAGIEQASAAQLLVVEHVRETGRLPNADEARALSDELVALPPVERITVESDSGVVVVDFSPGSVPGGGQVWLAPELAADGRNVSSWSCAGSVLPKHLPSHCRP